MNIKKIIGIIIISIILIIVMNTQVKAAGTFEASISATTVTVGDTISVTVKAAGAAGTYAVNTDNSIVSVVSGSTQDFLDNSSSTITYKAEKEGTVKITAKATDMTDNDNDEIPVNGSKSFTVIVKANQKQDPVSSTTTSQTTAPTTTTQKPTTNTATSEPNFTNANKTMYATGDINLRSSWSTSSAATNIKKGTELNVTATSSKTVNGYVWYRVLYNGQTKYVASSLLTSTKPEEETKSNNCNLKSLSIEGATILPTFAANVTSYTIQIEQKVEKVNVIAVAEDEKATISIKGNEQLKEGENLITVSVSAEDGTVKIYEINVEKLDKEAEPLGLKTLKIDGTDIDKRFKTDIYNYEIKVEEDVSKLKIDAIPTVETAIVEILGNDEIVEGENIITIMVSSQGGDEKITYQIKANKEIKVASLANTEEETSIFTPKLLIYIGAGVAVLIALIIVIAYTIKHRNQEQYEDFKFEDSQNNLDDRKKGEISDEKNTQEIGNISENVIEKKQEDEDIQNKNDYNFEEDRPRKRKGKHF